MKRLNVMAAAANWQHWYENFCKNESFSGIESITTFMSDFTIADFYGLKSVKETYERVEKNWLSDYKFWTELCCVLCHKSNMWYGSEDKPDYYWVDDDGYLKHPVNLEMSKLYSDLYYKAKDLFYEKYGEDKEACEYFFNVTD